MNKRFMKFFSTILVTMTISATNICSFLVFADDTKNVAEFNDLKDHWAAYNIMNFSLKGIVKGYVDGTFLPNNAVTRAEFITMVNKALKFTNTTDVNFADVEKTAWYYPEIEIAVFNKIISGYEDNTFRPNSKITRQEAAVIVNKLQIIDSSDDKAQSLDQFTDYLDIASWARKPLANCYLNQFINGYPDGTLKPQNPITRAEAVTILSNRNNRIDELYKHSSNYPINSLDNPENPSEISNYFQNIKTSKIELSRDKKNYLSTLLNTFTVVKAFDKNSDLDDIILTAAAMKHFEFNKIFKSHKRLSKEYMYEKNEAEMFETKFDKRFIDNVGLYMFNKVVKAAKTIDNVIEEKDGIFKSNFYMDEAWMVIHQIFKDDEKDGIFYVIADTTTNENTVVNHNIFAIQEFNTDEFIVLEKYTYYSN